FLIVSLSYLMNSIWVFHKNKTTGKIPFGIKMILAPYLYLAMYLNKVSSKFNKNNSINLLLDNIYLGGKTSFKELPEGIQTIIDLTAELEEDPEISKGKDYICFPILDASIPGKKEFNELLNKILELDSIIFIHCAEGSGRTGMVAVGLCYKKFGFSSFEEALEFATSKREKIKLNKTQKNFMEEVLKII
ncbi:MAG: dual specificity protein phosphatase family protein, partial [Leptospiraceae bacterium]|nr:dual specificity protein phosphatase family protein [Leptospiraceae bacterium]